MSEQDPDNIKVEKAYLAESGDTFHGAPSGPNPQVNPDDRGLNIYNVSQLQGVTGKAQNGNYLTGTVQRPLFSLSIPDRIEMFKRSTMLQGVVTSRAKRMMALKWTITKKAKDIEKLIIQAKELKEVYDEFSDPDVKSMTIRFQIKAKLQAIIPELKDDLSNFTGALRRYKKRNERSDKEETEIISEWIKQPSLGVTFSDFLHKTTIDLMLHGSAGVYKEANQQQQIENFYILPGGTIYPYRQTHVGGPEMYFQIIPSLESKAYFANEISYIRYVPVSWQTMGEVPVEALINKVAESLLFDKRAADQADGTRPPEKLVAFGKDPAPMGNLTDTLFDQSMPKAEQKRIETALNTARQEAIKTISGMGHPTVIDLTRSDTFSTQQNRQDKLLRDVALIFNMTNMEINLAGGEFTSGKETSDIQKEIEQEKGIGPILKMIEHLMNSDILPYRFGYDYEFKFDVGLSEQEQVNLEQQKINTGTYSTNELRESRGDDVYPEEEYDRPTAMGAKAPDGSAVNPLNMTGEVRTL